MHKETENKELTKIPKHSIIGFETLSPLDKMVFEEETDLFEMWDKDAVQYLSKREPNNEKIR